MPRPNQPRSIASEQALARRVAHEREARGMSYEGLASRMTGVGCAIQASGLYKIEKADPPRRITVDELVAFSQVFGVPVEQLLWPPEVAVSKELAELMVTWNNARETATRAEDEEQQAWARLTAYMADNPESREAAEPIIRAWVGFYFEENQHASATAMWMWKLTKDEKWLDEVRAYLDAE